MKSCLFLLLACLLLSGCSSHQGSAGVAPGHASRPKLKMEGEPQQGLAPMNVTFHATLSGVKPDEENYYCLEEQWDFGDGAVSAEQPNCEPYKPGTLIRTEFVMEHEYWQLGVYTVRFTLGKKKVLANTVQIRVLSTDLEHEHPGR